MKKRIITFVLTLCLFAFSFCTLGADAYSEESRILDRAMLLSAEEAEQLSEKADEISEKYSIEIVIVTVDSCGEYDHLEYAEMLYDELELGEDGIIAVYNTGRRYFDRSITIFADGTAGDAVTDSKKDSIIDDMIPYLLEGDAVGGFEVFLEECEDCLSSEKTAFLRMLPVALIIGFVLAFIVVGIEASKLKTVRRKVDAAEYVADVNLTAHRDRFLYRNVVKTPIPKNNSRSGSSGSSRGGVSRRF